MKLALTTLAALALAVSAGAVNATDWSGPSIGAYYGIDVNGFGSNFYGVRGGYDWSNGNFVYGGELDIATNGSGSVLYQIDGRAGMAVGNSALIFATLGGLRAVSGNTLWEIGVGAEVALSDKISLRGDYQYYAPTSGGGATGSAIKLGLTYGF